MRKARRDAGFAMAALVFFLTATSIFVVMVSVPSYIMQGQREREKELIFRGEEYARAIQKYQRTLNLLPASADELLQSNGTRFLRRAYEDPVTGEPWRIIILNSDGTLSGSNVFQTMAQVPTTTSVRNTATAAPAAPATKSVGSLATSSIASAAGATGLGGAGGAGTTGTTGGTGLGGAGGAGIGNTGGTGLGAGGGAGLTNNGANNGNRAATTGAVNPTQQQVAQPQQQATPLTGIIGVGSASKGTGVMVYNKQEQYINWEFLATLQQRNNNQGGGGTSGGQTKGGTSGGQTKGP